MDTLPRLKESPYPKYDKPLEMIGDALVLPDPEFPFHHADFINRCLDLCVAWGINQCIIAGDALHFASLSRWEADWIKEQKDGLSPAKIDELTKLMETMTGKARKALAEWVGEQETREETGGGVAAEVAQARKSLLVLGECFDRVDYVLGNHDARFLKTLDSPLFASKLLEFINIPDPKFRIAEYYYSVLISGGQKFRIEHPYGTTDRTPERLASINLCHELCAHSHLWRMGKDLSGKYWAIACGHTVDEQRLPYAAQRANNRPRHNLGAVIVRDGYPHLLGVESPWWHLQTYA